MFEDFDRLHVQSRIICTFQGQDDLVSSKRTRWSMLETAWSATTTTDFASNLKWQQRLCSMQFRCCALWCRCTLRYTSKAHCICLPTRVDPLHPSPISGSVVSSWLSCRWSSRPVDSAVCQCGPLPREFRARLQSQQYPVTPTQAAWQISAGLYASLSRRSNHLFAAIV